MFLPNSRREIIANPITPKPTSSHTVGVGATLRLKIESRVTITCPITSPSTAELLVVRRDFTPLCLPQMKFEWILRAICNLDAMEMPDSNGSKNNNLPHNVRVLQCKLNLQQTPRWVCNFNLNGGVQLPLGVLPACKKSLQKSSDSVLGMIHGSSLRVQRVAFSFQ